MEEEDLEGRRAITLMAPYPRLMKAIEQVILYI